jgi:hypothetical protein
MMLTPQQNVAAPQQTSALPELGHLKAAAERISNANYNLATFFTRFFGPVAESGQSAQDGEPIGCYRNDLTAVFKEIARLEELVTGLTNIG